MRHTKIVCTMGPACGDIEVLKKMLISGMNVARLNFSHGTHQDHLKQLSAVKAASDSLNHPVATLLDTKGPEIRLGEIKGAIFLKTGQQLVLTTKAIMGSEERISVSYEDLPKDLKPGDPLSLDDGLIGLEVLKIEDTEIFCLIKNDGELTGRKGVNAPGVQINLPAITDKDLEDILFGIKNKVDFIAASFVRTAADMIEIRKVLEKYGSSIHIIAKIETQAAVDNIEEILEVSDGIMVARGDLGVEIPAEEVPLVQKRIIALCNTIGKPVITATQMLDSMMRNPRPTRAEASDVANAIIDGTDAVMLSGETAVGRYPIEAVATMARIAEKTEKTIFTGKVGSKFGVLTERSITSAIGHATYSVAQELEAAAIITPTTSGSTARMVARHRPKAPIVAASPSEVVCRQLLLVWGVTPIHTQQIEGTDAIITTGVQAALEAGVISLGDLVVITAGVPVGIAGTTNLLKVHVVGNVVTQGQGIGRAVVTGTARLCKTPGEALAKVQKGDILVSYGTDKQYIPAMEKAGALITMEGGLTSHGAVVALSLGIPIIVGVSDVMEILQDGDVFTIDGSSGLVYKGVTRVL